MKAFIRFALAQGAVMSGMELLTAIFSIVQGIVTNIMSHSGMAGGTVTELPSEIVDKIEAVGMLESIPLWIVTLLCRSMFGRSHHRTGLHHLFGICGKSAGHRGHQPVRRDHCLELCRGTGL